MNQFFQWLAQIFDGARVWTTVLPWERGLRVRLGRWTKLWEPGLHWQLPFVDKVRVVNTRLRVAALSCITATTKDGKTVTVGGYVAFRIADPYRALLTIQRPEDAAAAFAQGEITAYLVAREIGEITPTEMEKAALGALRASNLDGLEFDTVRAVDFAIVRTYRLLQEQWRPHTGFSDFEPPRPGA